MIIECERCKRKFRIDDSKLKPPGNRVRCSKCGSVFFVNIKQESPLNINPLRDQALEKNSEEINAESLNVNNQNESESLSPSIDEKPGLGSIGASEPDTAETYEGGNELSSIDAGITESVEKSNGITETPFEKEWISLEEKEISLETSWLSGGRTDEKKTEDKVTWMEFAKPDEDKTEVKTDAKPEEIPNLQKEREGSSYDWDKMTIDQERSTELRVETPKTSGDSSDDLINPQLAAMQSIKDTSIEPPAPVTPTTNTFSVDRERASYVKRENPVSSPYYEPLGSGEKPMSSESSMLKKIGTAVVTLIALCVIIGAISAILLNLGIVPKHTFEKASSVVLSKVSQTLIHNLSDNIEVSDHSGRWISTKNGFIYVVSGRIVNQSSHTVHYIKIKSEFTSGGENLFEQVGFAGNTFTENELETLPFQNVLEKLKRKNGDIDYYNPEKLAGLNYGIGPGDYVPFFAVFPSTSKVLELEYNIEVVASERAIAK